MKMPRHPLTSLTPLATMTALLLAACGSPPATMVAAQPQTCAAAASASVAANNPVRGTTVRITKAEVQAATPRAKAHCLVDGRPYAIKFRTRLPEPQNWNGKFLMQGVGGSKVLWTLATACIPA